MPGLLQLHEINGRASYLLDGEPLREAEPVELLLGDGTWLRGIFEWSGDVIRWPGLRFKLGGDGAPYTVHNSRTAIVSLPPDAVLRRSARSAAL